MPLKSFLEFRLLGPVSIQYQNQPLIINRRIERLLLYYLAAEHQAVSRSTLIDLLWPESEQADPRGALRTALSRLRKELPDSDFLQTEFDRVSLDLARCRIDLFRFKTLYQNLQSTLSAYPANHSLPAQIVQQIQEGLSFWHGDTFLQGEDLTAYPVLLQWHQGLNNHLAQQQKSLLRRLAQHYHQSGQLDMALDLFKQLAQTDLLDVAVHLGVIDCMTMLGRHQDSIHYCDELEGLFENEFNMPLPDAIMERCQYARIQTDLNEKHVIQQWPEPLTRQLPLVGRQAELSSLRQDFYRGGIVHLQGELGTGKTRLVQELYQILQPKPALILAAARQLEQSLPLAPMINGIRRSLPENTWKEIDAVWANHLAVLFPELTQLRDDCGLPKARLPRYPKQHLFDAIQHLLTCYARDAGRLLIFLDDAHWADHQTLEAISYLVMQHFFDQHGLLIIASRPEESSPLLNNMINQFFRSHQVDEIRLPNLTVEELGELAYQAMNTPPATQFVDRLYYETNGNPLIALEIIHSILDSTEAAVEEAILQPLPLPANIQALIRRRLDQLDQDARYILLCAAVLGNQFSLKLIQSIIENAQLPEHATLDRLIESGFLLASEQGQPESTSLQFVHEKMREVVLKEATPIQLKVIQRRVAQHLSVGPHARARAAIIAGHYLAADDLAQAFKWYLEAADYAWSLSARESARDAFNHAEQILENAPPGFFTVEDLLAFYSQHREFAYQSSQIHLLDEIGVKLNSYADRYNHPALIGLSQMAFSNAFFLRNQLNESIDLIEKAIEHFKSAENSLELTRALLFQGIYYWWKPDYQVTYQAAQRVIESCQSASMDPFLVEGFTFHARLMICLSHVGQGNAKKAVRIARETHDRYYHKMDPYNRMRSLNALAQSAYLSGDHQAAQRFAHEGIPLTQALENTYVEHLFQITAANAAVVMGQLDLAYQHAKRALEIGESHQEIDTIVSAHCVLGDIFIILHNYTKAAEHYRLGQLRSGVRSNSHASLENSIHLARMLTWTGKPAEARENIREILEQTQKSGMKALYIKALLVDGICDLMAENTTDAEAKFSRAAALAQENGLQHELTWSRIRLARLKLFCNEKEAAEELLHEVFEQAKTLKMAWLLYYCYELFIQLKNIKDKKDIPQEIQSALDELIARLDENIRSEALIEDYRKTRSYWTDMVLYP